MERGLIWLPLLGLFIWLARKGWQEYQKVEGYRIWSEKFDKAKYDIYAVIGKKDRNLTWGTPTPKGILDLQTFSLNNVARINLLLGDRVIDFNDIPTENIKAIPSLEFQLTNQENSIKIPFTDLELAAKWAKYLINSH
ncbi:hypothetical protein Xen7305DRAFT_00011700 [Xenococcus sp. PCC 7305]|uniref:hypothetical protein n=1 Tax=Xenococcus sp. PCC 7305 TaxID=102125 RepID=UPI0002AB9E0B|nr:hypothetical protein [Xenococcus sp. PCC 7305]ELS01466.1 hypothetical protein Xen7305DRAFT_00011700 [Xenococcus sp. PCC 7305]